MALETDLRADPRPDAAVHDRTWGWVLLMLLAVAIAARELHPMQISWLRNLLIVFGSLLIEAMPFVALGALVSAAIEVFVPASSFAKIARLPRAVQLPAAAFAGMAFPVCECGSVPVARRLARKGLSPAAAVTFMLAAPIVNPVVIASTYVAYRGRDSLALMVIGRFTLGLIVAMCVGWVIGALRPDGLLRADATIDDPDDADEPRARRFFTHLSGDLIFMARFLILGALIAATIQTFVPASIADRVATLPVLSLLAMMFLAFILSLCSESDAFVAASFTAFGPSAQLAFLVFGPMVDLKLAALYVGTYSKSFFRTVLIVVTAVTLVATLWVEVLWGMSAITASVAERWSPSRIATGLVLGAWGAMFWVLWLTDRTYLYLSTRTAWLVPMGAVIMSVAAIGRLATARTAHDEPLGSRRAWMLGVIALPVVLVLTLPPTALGAYSVGKRATFGGSAIGATARDVTGPLDFVDIGAAQSFPAAMQQLEARAGEPITLEGFVTHEASAPPDEIVLTRYIMTCCVADATIAQVRVVGLPAGAYPDDEWLSVTGAVYPVGREVLVAADSADPIPVPEQPYLTP